MTTISKEQIKAIYTMGSNLGIVESGNSADDLHYLVDGLIGKSSISALSAVEGTTVIRELNHRLHFQSPTKSKSKPKPKPKPRKSTPKGMTPQQQNKVWALMYSLRSYDIEHRETSIGSRLTGVIKKELQIDATAKSPFEWLDAVQGEKLIEVLKNYTKSAKKQFETRGVSDG